MNNISVYDKIDIENLKREHNF